MWPFPKSETRAVATSDPYISDYLGTRTGVGTGYVDPVKASGHAVAHRCISVISENLAAVPLKVYRHTDAGGREAASDHPLYPVLHDQANEGMTAFEAREFLLASVLTYGNGYARIERNGRGQVTALYPLPPSDVTVERLSTGRLRYKVATGNAAETLLQDEVLHVRYRTRDGVMGISPIQHAAATFGLALAQSDQACAQAENAFRPAGALVFPEKLSGAGKESIITKFKDRLVGQLKANEVMVLDGGAKFETFQIPNRDAEFLESRKLSNLDICRIFGVPPSVAGILDDATYSNIGEESRALVVRCLAPWARRIEQAANIALLSAESRKSLFIEHDLAGLLRGDLKSRYEAYRTGREGGWLSANEIRRLENMPAIDGGDAYLRPLNMGDLSAEAA